MFQSRPGHALVTSDWPPSRARHLAIPRLIGHERRMSDIEFAPYRHLRSLACALTLAAAALLTGSMRESSAASPMAGASEWSPGLHAAMRLLDGGPDDRSGRTFKAGVEIRLDPHFKTYWRTPGNSGIPPVFEWSQSQNVANVEVLWPAPYRFEDTAGASIGYKDRVIFPSRSRPPTPSGRSSSCSSSTTPFARRSAFP